MPVEDTVQAFVPGPRAMLEPTGLGALNGLDFAAKDLFDVAGWRTGGGNPDWERTHPEAAATAPAVLALLEAGARLVGKTRTVELAFGLTGENVWQGTPVNPAAPSRFPGGSSCGSASAVAAGLVAFALGTDTAGSVRIPASYCGVFGFRPSWGVVSLAGVMALAPSFDACGWFARSAAVLRRVGEVLLPEDAPSTPRRLGPLVKLQSVWMNADPATAAALTPALEAAERVLGLGEAIRAETGHNSLRRAYETARHVQAQEAWVTHGPWIEQVRPRFGPGVGERFAAAKATDPEKAAAGRHHRRRFAASMRALLQGGAVLAFPTSPNPAPLLEATAEEQNAVRERTIGVTAHAGLAGLCEVTLPAAQVEGAPVGLSLAAAPGHDRALLELAERIAAELGIGE